MSAPVEGEFEREGPTRRGSRMFLQNTASGHNIDISTGIVAQIGVTTPRQHVIVARRGKLVATSLDTPPKIQRQALPSDLSN